MDKKYAHKAKHFTPTTTLIMFHLAHNPKSSVSSRSYIIYIHKTLNFKAKIQIYKYISVARFACARFTQFFLVENLSNNHMINQ